MAQLALSWGSWRRRPNRRSEDRPSSHADAPLGQPERSARWVLPRGLHPKPPPLRRRCPDTRGHRFRRQLVIIATLSHPPARHRLTPRPSGYLVSPATTTPRMFHPIPWHYERRAGRPADPLPPRQIGDRLGCGLLGCTQHPDGEVNAAQSQQLPPSRPAGGWRRPRAAGRGQGRPADLRPARRGRLVQFPTTRSRSVPAGWQTSLRRLVTPRTDRRGGCGCGWCRPLVFPSSERSWPYGWWRCSASARSTVPWAPGTPTTSRCRRPTPAGPWTSSRPTFPPRPATASRSSCRPKQGTLTNAGGRSRSQRACFPRWVGSPTCGP